MLVTQDEARVIIQHLMTLAQKARSNMSLNLAGVEEMDSATLRVLQEMEPRLWKEPTLVDHADRLLSRPEMTPSDFANFLWRVTQSETLAVMAALHDLKIPEFDPMMHTRWR